MADQHLRVSLERPGNELPSSAEPLRDHASIFEGRVSALSIKATQATESAEAWEAVLETMSKFDDKQISDWMDDLQNLLTFAGLFSAIVTAFVVLSYALLQQDSGDLTAATVQNISQQVASFTVSSNFINATANIQTPDASAPFTPDSLAIKVNTLWMLSLTMSLVASLFDIMVQQWLREYRTPTNSSVREAVRLREMRRRAFTDWAVPAIVSLIPILLELALVLFFIGQCQLFAAVNKTVFIPFAVFLGVALLMFTIATVMPLFSRTCAYKSPTSFAVLWVLKGALTTLSAVVTAGIYLYMLVAAWAISRAAATFMPALRPKAQIWATDASKSFWNFWVNINRPLRRTAINRRSSGSEYWVARERDVLQHEEHLDERALSWALPWLPQEKLPLLRRCFADLCPEERIRVVVKWIAQTLNSSTRRLRVDRGSDLDFGVLDKIDGHFADWYCEALMDVLPKRWMESAAPVECKYGPTVLIILQRIATGPRKDDAVFVSEYITRLMALRASQHLKIDSDSSIVRLPTIYLFQCSNQFGDMFTKDDLSLLCNWAMETLQHDHHHPDHISYWITFFDVLLASAATTLCIVTKHPQWLSEDPAVASSIATIVDGLEEFIKRDEERICALASNAKKWCTDGVAFATLPAIEAVCESVVALARAGYLWQDHASPTRRLVRALAGLFAAHKVFTPAGTVLSELDVIEGGGMRSPSEAKEEFLADPVVPRMGYTPKYLPSSP